MVQTQDLGIALKVQLLSRPVLSRLTRCTMLHIGQGLPAFTHLYHVLARAVEPTSIPHI